MRGPSWKPRRTTIAEAVRLGKRRRRTRPIAFARWRSTQQAGLGLQPHRSETFKLSSDPFFVEKVRDIVGRAPPDRALVPCRRKEPDPGPGPFPAPLADAPRAGGAAQPRLQAPRHDLSLRGPRHRHGRDRSANARAESSANSSTSSRRTSLLISTYATGSPNGTREQVERWFGLLTDKQIRRGGRHQGWASPTTSSREPQTTSNGPRR